MLIPILISFAALVAAWICSNYLTEWLCYTTYRTKWPEWALWAPALLNIGQLICILVSTTCFTFITLHFQDEFIFGGMVNISVPIWQFFLSALSILAIMVGTVWFLADLISWSIPHTLRLFGDPKERWRIKRIQERKAEAQV